MKEIKNLFKVFKVFIGFFLWGRRGDKPLYLTVHAIGKDVSPITIIPKTIFNKSKSIIIVLLSATTKQCMSLCLLLTRVFTLATKYEVLSRSFELIKIK